MLPRGGGGVGKIEVQAIPGAGLSKSDFRLRAAYRLSVGWSRDTTAEPADYNTQKLTLLSPFGISGVANPVGVIPILDGVTWSSQDYCLKGVYRQKDLSPFEYGSWEAKPFAVVDTNITFPFGTLLQDNNGGGSDWCYAKIASIALDEIDSEGRPVISVTGKYWANTSSMRYGVLNVVLEFGLK